MSIDPSKLTVGNLLKEISNVEDIEALKEILTAETNGKNRKGALSGIQQQIESIEVLGPSGVASPNRYLKPLYYLVFILLAVWAITNFI